MNTVKKHVGHGIKQVQLLNYLLNNLSQFKLKPTTKLVLLYLAGCYNPEHVDVFPKQKTIALQMGISERSVISAIQELHEKGLVISERKYTNRYKFTSRILNLGDMVEDFSHPEEIADTECKNCTSQSENFAPPYIGTTIEQEKNNEKRVKEINSISETIKIDEYRILRKYAESKGAQNIQRYVNALVINGSAKEILKAHKERLAVEEYHKREVTRTQELIAKQREDFDKAVKPTECDAIRKVLSEKFGRKFP